MTVGESQMKTRTIYTRGEILPSFKDITGQKSGREETGQLGPFSYISFLDQGI